MIGKTIILENINKIIRCSIAFAHHYLAIKMQLGKRYWLGYFNFSLTNIYIIVILFVIKKIGPTIQNILTKD